MKKIFSAISILLATLLVVSGLPQTAFAAANKLYLTPASSSIKPGQHLSLQLRIGPESSTKGIRSHLEYDSSKLEFKDWKNDQSSFETIVVDSQIKGEITLGATKGSGSGDRLVLTLEFKALALGTARVSFVGINQTLEPVLILLTTWRDVETSGGSYRVAQPPTTPKPTKVSPLPAHTDGTSKPQVSSSKRDSESSSKPAIKQVSLKNIRVVQVSEGSAQIEWATSEPTSTTLFFKTEADELIGSVSKTNFSTTHSIKLESLRPNTTYGVEIEATTKDGRTQNGEATFNTKEGKTSTNTFAENTSFIITKMDDTMPKIMAPLSAMGVTILVGAAVFDAYRRRRMLHAIQLSFASILVTNHHMLRRFSRIKV